MILLRELAKRLSWVLLGLWVVVHTPLAFVGAAITITDRGFWTHPTLAPWAIVGMAVVALFVAIRVPDWRRHR